MNKRIYFQDKYIEFTDVTPQKSKDKPFKTYHSLNVNDTSLNDLVREFCDDSKKECVYIVNQDFNSILEKLKKHFYFIEAAGGFIEKDLNYLFIRRHNRWDLPKGKLEANEGITNAAIRECEEECGIKNLRINHELTPTYHVYQYKKGYALKQSHWFYMQSGFSGKLSPQLEEHITEVRWFNRKEVEAIALKDTYYTIADVAKEALQL